MTFDPQELVDRSPYYTTDKGAAYHGDSRKVMSEMPENSVDLIVISPPFALNRKKEYGNEDQADYNDWFMDFAEEAHRILKESGSFIVDIGGGWKKGSPTRSLYHFKLLNRLAGEEESPFHLAQDFYWYNPSKLPTPAQWVTIEKIRATDAVNHVWWLSKGERPKADTTKVLQEYSDRQKELMEGGYEEFGVDKKDRPSGHKISDDFDKDNDGSLPDNLLEIPNSKSNTKYLRACRELDVDAHPARFPRELPEFFIKLCSDEDDVVLDFFAGSNMTGWLAEMHNRKWIAIEEEEKYLDNSKLRFMNLERIKKEEGQQSLDEIGLD